MPSQNKVELNELTQVVHKEHAFLVALNENFLRLQQAINDTLSRSGVVPNQMEEVLDMNGKRVINVGEAVEDTDAVTRAFIKDLIADVEAAVSRLNTLVEQAKEALAVYAAEYILPPAIAARDDAIAAKNAAKGYYDDTKLLYDQLESLVTNLNALLAVASDITNVNAVAGDLTNIDTLAAVSSAITTCANDIAAIIAAPTYAAHAETWAEGDDTAVSALGGTHSAKRWAELSQADVAAEATARENADIGLQNQIDAITAGADVRDIVGTYADLQAYDTSDLHDKDIVKVISDSTHNDASTYYRWVITDHVGAWVYIGAEGPYLTPSAASSTYVPQTRTVNSKPLSGDITLSASDVGAATSAQGTKADTAVQPGDLATVATTGDYDDLLNKPTIPSLSDAIVSSQVTIATTDWAGNTCTKSVTGVTASSDVFVAPAPVLANIKAYSAANVFCSAVGAGTVTFTCETTPTDTLTVNIGVN